MLKLCWFFPWLITITVTIWKDNQIAAKRSLQFVEMRHNSKGVARFLWINPVHSGRLMSFIQKQTTLNERNNKQHITVPFWVMKLTKVPYSAGNQCDHCKKAELGTAAFLTCSICQFEYMAPRSAQKLYGQSDRNKMLPPKG